ncbi:MAG: MMPL family transporter [Planctomycetes bacterium]|nr:MMPL family transporter [Planctomycetota bacterium]
MSGRVAALALVVAGLGALVGARLQVTTEVTAFLALGDDARAARLARALAESELTRALVLVVRPGGAVDPDLAARAGAALEEALAGDPAVSWVKGGVAADVEREVHALLFPRRAALISVAPDDELPALLSDEGLRAHAKEVRRQLELPTAPLVKRLLPDDPLLAFPRALERLEAAGGDGLRVHQGRLLTPDGGAAVLLVGTVASPFDTASAGPLLARLEAHRARLSAALGAPLALERSGVHPFAVAAERSIRADVARISAASTAAIVVLLLVLFRSPRAVPASAAPVVVGLLAGASAVLVLHGQVHGLTLAFGATLIGVCIDHPLHVMTHHALTPRGGPLAAARAVWPGLRLAGLTTVVGLGGLAFSGFPGLREVGLFTTTGVLAALATTRWLVPALLPPAADPTPLQRGAARACAAAFAALRARPRLALAPALVAAALAAAGLSRAG